MGLMTSLNPRATVIKLLLTTATDQEMFSPGKAITVTVAPVVAVLPATSWILLSLAANAK